MSSIKCFGIVTFCLLFFANFLLSQIVLQGVVTDNGSEPVQDALIELFDQTDAKRKFVSNTNDKGQYFIQVFETGVDDKNMKNPSGFNLFQNYPNPFNPSTIITYEVSKPVYIRIEIYNVLGQRIKTLFDGFQSNNSGQVIWDATDDLDRRVSAGVYIYSLISDGFRISKKMFLIDSYRCNTYLPLFQPMVLMCTSKSSINMTMSNEYFLRVTGKNIKTYERPNFVITSSMIFNIKVTRTVMDIDGNIYKTVKIGDQWWMAENLKTTRYRNGEAISNVTDGGSWSSLTIGAYCNYNNDVNLVATYGRLYNWHAVKDGRNITPAGWHVPSDSEWKQLEMFLGMSQSEADGSGRRRGTNEGGKLKETGTSHWASPNTGADNSSGFTALPGGYRADYGNYYFFGEGAFFWSSTEYNGDHAWYRDLDYYTASIGRFSLQKPYGFSVCCVRDN